MIAGIQAKMFRPHPVSVGMRQHVASRSNHVLSKHVAKIITLTLVLALFLVFTLSQFLHWYIMSSAGELKELQSLRNSAGTENIQLLAQRAQLASKDYVVDKAGTKFKLVLPGKHQVQRL